MKIEFFAQLDEIPRTTAQQKGVNHKTGKFYTKNKVSYASKLYDLILLRYKPPRPLVGAIRLKIIFYFPVKKPHKHGEPKITRPDVDNMAKLLIDRCGCCGGGGVYWNDDAQISDLRIIKAYAEESGIYFKAVEIGQGGVEQ